MLMKIVKLFMACLLAAAVSVAAYAQGTVSGKVTDVSGNPIPGASVFIEGTSIGTVTDLEGAYSLNLRAGATSLKFSFFGMRDAIVPVSGGGVIDVTLEEDTIGLDGVVITASGMTRQEKTLGYASTTVRSDEIVKGHAADALSGLSGKIAGVQISSSGATGSSQKVIVRGYSSFSSNSPLYVIDGVPVSNGTMGVQDLNNSVDYGNQAADINPEDIESITVLKGASATALYGSRAGNGAIIITTKRGKQNEEFKVTYDGSVQLSSILRIPVMQNRFGQGWGYSYEGLNVFENYSYTENGSWGNILDGRQVEWRPGAYWAGNGEQQFTTFDYKANSLKNFYTLGVETNNSVTLQGGSKNTGFVVSYGNIYSDGILSGKNDVYKRHNFSFRGNTKIYDGVAWLNYSVNYTRKDARNVMTGQGGDGSTIFNDILQYPVNIDYADLKDYDSIYNNSDNFYTPYAQNPWWILGHNWSKYSDDRVFGNIEAGINIIKGLQFISRAGLDVTNYVQKDFNDLYTFNPGSYTESEGGSPEIGSYREESFRTHQIDANFLLNADYRIKEDWSIHGILGYNINQRGNSYQEGVLTGITVPGWASFENSSGATPTASSYESLRRLVGAYGQADFGWKDAIFLTLSARNDWSSTLPVNANSFFYWGANASVLLTDLIPAIKSDVLNFVKIRGGYGQTGNDAPAYYTRSFYAVPTADGGFGSLTFPLDGFLGLMKSTRIPADNLKPEISTEAEVGLDVRLFKNRLNFDVALYDKVTKNQIIMATLAPESGNASKVRNVGKIRNRGIEVSLGAVPVKTKDFEWNIGYTFSSNKNIVEELWDDVKEYTVTGLTTGPQLKAFVGESMGTWVDYKIATVEDPASPDFGKVIIDPETGYPDYDPTVYEVLGKADSDFTMGFNTVLRYKGLSLSANIDWRHGGKMYSATHSILMFTGNGEETMYNMRDPWIWPNSVIEVADGVYEENNIPVDGFYNINGVHYDNYNYVAFRNSLLDKSYVKLREVALSYKLPSKLFDSIKWLSGVEVSLIGRNLLMWTPKQGVIDPDVSNFGNDLGSLYGEFYAAPSTRSFGGSVKIVF